MAGSAWSLSSMASCVCCAGPQIVSCAAIEAGTRFFSDFGSFKACCHKINKSFIHFLLFPCYITHLRMDVGGLSKASVSHRNQHPFQVRDSRPLPILRIGGLAHDESLVVRARWSTPSS